MKTTTDAGADEGFHEIHLSGKQLVFLCMATTVVSVVIFLCGVLVGRGVRAAQGDETMVASAATVPAMPGVAERSEDLAAPVLDAAPGDGSATEGLSYPRRLEEVEAKEPLGTSSNGPPPAEEKPADSPVRDVPRGTTATSRPTPEPVATAAAAPPTPPPAAPNRTGYVVQVAAVHTRPEADEMAKRLADKGYPAYVVEPPGGMRNAVFRVRVGGYPDREQAQEISRRLEQQEQFKSPWITR